MQITLRDYQQNGVNGIKNEYRIGFKAPMFVLSTGGGKCLAENTPVLMFDGSIKMVQNVIPGDLLMGPDSKPRKVETTCTGSEDMYKITPVKGDSFTVNESHILSFKITPSISNGREVKAVCAGKRYSNNEIANVSVLDYINSSNTFKHRAKIWRSGVDFENTPINKLPPYFIGIWLGDGSYRNPSITIHNDDIEIIEYIEKFASVNKFNLRVEFNSENSKNYHLTDVEHQGRKGSFLNNIFKSLGVYKNKHIPKSYLISSRKQRLELLAGLIDSDGHLHNSTYEILTKSERLNEDILFLSRSLGFAAYSKKCVKKIKSLDFEGEYFRISISGDVSEIPVKVDRKKSEPRKQKKSVLRTGVKSIQNIGKGNYYGFEISGPDRLFLLGDFTVTHNTVVFTYISQQSALKNSKVLILVHRVELLRQTSMALDKFGVEHGLINPKYTPNLEHNVQVASVQTLVRRLKTLESNNFTPDIIIIDECHHATAGQWKKIIDAYPDAKILGVTATPIRGDGKGLGVEYGGVFDTMVLGPSIKELIERGYLVRPKVYAPPRQIDFSSVRIKYGDFDKKQVTEIMDKPTVTGDAVKHYQKLCSGVPAVAFCMSVEHAKHVAEEFTAAGYRAFAVDGSMDDDVRTKILNGLGNGTVDVVTSCDLISEGTDIPAIGCAILLRPTQSTGLYIQQVGRALRPSEGKEFAVILDHVGNTLTHGMPDEDRQWSLEGKKQTRRKKNDDEVNVMAEQCKQCYIVYKPQPVCPNCGYVKPVKKPELIKIDGELIEVTPENRELISKKKRMQVGRASSLEELQQIAQERGYSRGWAWKIWNTKKI